MAIGCEATFVARSIDVNIKHLSTMLKRAAEHRGTSFVEVYQNCNVFNDGAFEYATDNDVKADRTLELEHGKPLIFGSQQRQGRLGPRKPSSWKRQRSSRARPKASCVTTRKEHEPNSPS